MKWFIIGATSVVAIYLFMEAWSGDGEITLLVISAVLYGDLTRRLEERRGA